MKSGNLSGSDINFSRWVRAGILIVLRRLLSRSLLLRFRRPSGFSNRRRCLGFWLSSSGRFCSNMILSLDTCSYHNNTSLCVRLDSDI
jgi:hypothetical protein